MAFDLSTAKPVEPGGFDLSTAKPIDTPVLPKVKSPSGFKQGFLDPLVGLAQLGEMIPGVSWLRNATGKIPTLWGGEALPDLPSNAASQLAQKRERDYQAARQQAGDSGIDWARMAGNLVQPVNYIAGLASAPAMSGVKTLPAIIAAAKYGAKAGGISGLMQPATNLPSGDTTELAKEKVKQAMLAAGLGGAMSGAVTGGLRAAGAIREGTRNLRLPWKEGGYKEIALKSDLHLIPESYQDDVIATARQAQPEIPNTSVTLAEALSKPTKANPYGHPGGGSLRKAQEITYKTQGAPAAEGHKVLAKSLEAQIAYKGKGVGILDQETAPLREQALAAVKEKGGVPVRQVIAEINDILRTEEVAGRPFTEKGINGIISWLMNKGRRTGKIDGNTFYEFKKEGINQVVDKIYEGNPSGAAKFKASKFREIEDIFDNAIKRAGGGQTWDKYLKTYKAGMDKLEMEQAMKGVRPAPPGETIPFESFTPEMYKPLQKVSAGQNIATPAANETALKGPPLLNRYYAIAKWLPEWKARQIEPLIDEYRAQIYAHAPTWADEVTKIRDAEQGRKAVIDALIRRGLLPASVAAGQTQ